MSVFLHLTVSPPQVGQFPSEFAPPQDPVNGFLLNIMPIAIPAIAMSKMIIPSTIFI